MTESNNLARTVLVIVFILALPLVAMQFTDEVVWDVTDFIVAGMLLLGASFIYKFMARKITATPHRVIVGVVIGMIFLLIWVELAVGIFGTPWAGV